MRYQGSLCGEAMCGTEVGAVGSGAMRVQVHSSMLKQAAHLIVLGRRLVCPAPEKKKTQKTQTRLSFLKVDFVELACVCWELCVGVYRPSPSMLPSSVLTEAVAVQPSRY